MKPTDEMLVAAEALAACFADSWNRQDGPAYGSAYWEDAELVDPTGTIWDGRTAIEAMHVDLWRGSASGTSVTAAVRKVRPFSPTLMVLDLEVEVTGFSPPPPGASSSGRVRTRLKHIVEKRGVDWKIAASQNTFVAGQPT